MCSIEDVLRVGITCSSSVNFQRDYDIIFKICV